MRGQQRPITEDEAAEVSEIFRALGDTRRVAILAALLRGERSVGSLASTAGISDSAVSHHLRGLRQMHLVRGRKTGRMVFYRLDDEHIADLLRRGLDHVRHR
jgi:DNA-binding transcriptional ArsR family regulator